MFIYKGYRWTFIDLVLAASIASIFLYFAIDMVIKEGVSLASIAGVIWGFGTLIFFMLYPFPIFGGPVEGERLLKEKEIITKEEFKKVLGRSNFSDMPNKTIKIFLLFFLISGGLTLVGLFANI